MLWLLDVDRLWLRVRVVALLLATVGLLRRRRVVAALRRALLRVASVTLLRVTAAWREGKEKQNKSRVSVWLNP